MTVLAMFKDYLASGWLDISSQPPNKLCAQLNSVKHAMSHCADTIARLLTPMTFMYAPVVFSAPVSTLALHLRALMLFPYETFSEHGVTIHFMLEVTPPTALQHFAVFLITFLERLYLDTGHDSSVSSIAYVCGFRRVFGSFMLTGHFSAFLERCCNNPLNQFSPEINCDVVSWPFADVALEQLDNISICLWMAHTTTTTEHPPLTGMPRLSSCELWELGSISAPHLVWGAIRNNKRHECNYCGLILLTGERPGFCCGDKGKFLGNVPALPPLPDEYLQFINDPGLSNSSRILNLVFSFASLETSEEFPWLKYSKNIPAFFSIQGRVYHRLRTKHRDSSVRWLLFDGFADSSLPHAQWASTLPPVWISAVKNALLRVNPFVQSLMVLSGLSEAQCPGANIVLREGSSVKEIAAIINYENTTSTQVQSDLW
ncbi:hypothetical protein D9758_013533 [Tetrapyrgos nigripes]|uniref:Uncharacterized protein n=1 Tax=Tetrapyrgos nigripes TaxID=182062 RepID=A0A8H5FWK9_9AGAR|nr:hypothetical protein D9758_013533 [Tetrapyrgos nigripes]